MQARLYIDEDAMDDDLVQALRLRGVDVETALEAGLVGRPDEEQLAHAAEAGRVLYTFNVGDFMNLHGEYISSGQLTPASSSETSSASASVSRCGGCCEYWHSGRLKRCRTATNSSVPGSNL